MINPLKVFTNMILRLTLTILGLSSLLLSQEETEKSVSVTQTRRLDFPTDGIRTSGALSCRLA